MIEKLITDYLAENRRLVLPELGAFLRKDGSAVVFVPFLNKDDGVLNAIVKQNYGISQVEATAIIAQYISVIRDSISERGFYLVETLGTLRKDANNIIFLDAGALSPQDADMKPKKVVQVQEEPAAEETKEVSFEVEPKKEEAKTAPAAETRAEPKIPAAEPKPAQKSQPRQAPVEEIKTVDKRATVKATEEQSPYVRPSKGESSKKKPDLIFVIAIIAAAIAIGVMIYGYVIQDLPVFNL